MIATQRDLSYHRRSAMNMSADRVID